MVLATQNPVELAGTFPLPEAQLDRFLFKLTMGYPDYEAERLVMRGNAKRLEVEQLDAVINAKQVEEMIELASEVTLPSAVESYILDITHATRADAAVTLGAGPRASIALGKASRVMAASDGRDTVYPEDVKALLRPVCGHRMMLTPDAVLRGETIDDVLERVLGRVKPPLGLKERAAETVTEGAVATRSRARRGRAKAASGAP
jgi:MoxR-like ATPase